MDILYKTNLRRIWQVEKEDRLANDLGQKELQGCSLGFLCLIEPRFNNQFLGEKKGGENLWE